MTTSNRGGLSRLIKLVVWGLIVAALAQELRRSPEDREWHGQVAGMVPYDFRPPSPDRMRRSWWNPDGALFQPQVFGVGWTINFGRLREILRSTFGA